MSILLDAIKRSQADETKNAKPHNIYKVMHPLSKSKNATLKWLSLFFFFGLSVSALITWYKIKPESVQQFSQWVAQRQLTQPPLLKQPEIEFDQKVKIMQPKPLTPKSKPANFDTLRAQIKTTKITAQATPSARPQATPNKSEKVSPVQIKQPNLSTTVTTKEQTKEQAEEEPIDLNQQPEYDQQTLALIQSIEESIESSSQKNKEIQDISPLNQRGILQNYLNLPEELRQELPPLTINVHNFSSNPKKRFIVIGNQSIYEGQQITEHLKLIQVRFNEVIYSFHNVRFRAPALETW